MNTERRATPSLRGILSTRPSWAPLPMRLALAVAIFPHGAQKALGWFGGYGFAATMEGFTRKGGFPWFFALLAVVAEFLGPVGLALGLLTRVAAFGIAVVMAVAATKHFPNGFFMNWVGTQAGEGFEYHLLALGLAVALTITGGGKASLDSRLTR